ncbi:MAG TPA: lipase maturation factor family protein [Terriglobia bacterium]|nr:lipase maturation factor family protein [Terriglobia bacterium]
MANNEKLSRPLLLFDGDCGFCRYWVARWRILTRGALDFAPAQAEASRFPKISKEAWSRSVQLVTPEGEIYSGAEAVFRSLAYAPEHAWKLGVYRHLPGAKPVCEWAYRTVAAHRNLFSKLSRLTMGRDPEPPSYAFSQWLFLRLLGLIYVIAFLSLRVQILGLVGSRGILPAGLLLQLFQKNFGSASHRLFPTLAWFSSSDASLKLLCSGGALFGLLVFVGLAARPALILAWTFYLSLFTVGRDFLSFQWDLLLLEAGFLAIFMAAWRPVDPPWRSASHSHQTLVLWLGRWLLFRLMFLSGSVKLLSGDSAWRNLTALQFHYWTQPLPTPVAWYAAQLPAWFQKVSVVAVLVLELGVPFLIFAPRRLRRAAAFLIIGFQLLIAITGNYAFFNLLGIFLCVLLIDDVCWRRWLPNGLVQRIVSEAPAPAHTRLASAGRTVRAALAVVILVVSGSEMLMTFNQDKLVPGFARQMVEWQSPYGIANSYGLFAVMTTSRLEIAVEGSDDGRNWLPYEFKYKPGELARRPPWVAPYQPRLDWQMWFAALGSYQQNRWFANLLIRLLEGSPDVIALLETNPFPNAPPRYIRAVGYEYHFTDFASRRATGDWWRRDWKGLYFPVASLRGQ